MQPFVRRELLHLYGSFSIYNYGVAIALGLLIFMILIKRHPQFKALKLENSFVEILILGIGIGILGGRTLFVITEEPSWNLSNFLSFWEGGFSILGSIIAILLVIPWYLHYKKISILPFLDLVAIYAPLLQAISRIGCFFAGCCYGTPTTAPWGFIYTDQGSAAPQGICLHPTQIYSVIALLIVFLIMYFPGQWYARFKGELLCFYIILMSTERFLIDFWRAERILIETTGILSLSAYQAIAGVLFFVTSICLILLRARHINTHEHI